MDPDRPSAHARFTAQTPEQARLLLDLSYFKVLGRVMHAPSSAGEVAQAAGLSVKQAHHRLTRLLGAGLAEVCEERARGGRAVKIYRAVADEYRVPFALTSAATLGEVLQTLQGPFLAEQNAAIAQALTRFSSGDVELRLNERDGLQASLGELPHRDGESTTVYSTFAEGHCTPEVVAELERRVKELAEWFQANARGRGEGRQAYQLGLLLTPKAEGEES